MLLYLDNCCLNRPYDDQAQLRIYLETLAKLSIQESILSRRNLLAWSYVLDYEVGRSPFVERRERFLQWKQIAARHCNESESILQKAEEVQKKGTKVVDSLHIACAINMECDYLVTTDDGMLGKDFEGIMVIGPLDFIKITAKEQGDD